MSGKLNLQNKSSKAIQNSFTEEWMQSVPCGICKVNLDDKFSIVMANDQFYKIFEVSKSEADKVGYDSFQTIMQKTDFLQFKERLYHSIIEGLETFTYEAGCINFVEEWIHLIFRCRVNTEDGTNQANFTCVMIDITDRKKTEDQLRISEEEHRLILRHHTGRIIIRYEILDHILIQSDYSAKLLGMPNVMYHVPESIVNAGYLAKECEEDFVNFFRMIELGEPSGKCIVRLKNFTGVFCWYQCDYIIVFDDEKKPIRAIISYEDITEQREKELAYKKWKQYNEKQMRGSIAYYEFNLTKDTFDRIDGELSTRLPYDVRASYSEVIQYASEHFLYHEDKEKYFNLFSRETLLVNYYTGKRECQLEHRRISRTGKVFWTRGDIQLLPDPYSDDIKGFVLVKDINDKKTGEQEILERLKTDSLTGLLNRRASIESINSILKSSSTEQMHAIIMVDIDNFKQLNDTMGHQFGDKMLNEIAKDLRSILRADDIVGRLGGDEFVILLKNMVSQDLLKKKIISINEFLYRRVNSELIISGSLGVAIYPRDGQIFEELYQNADIALYEAKKLGRNQHAFFQTYMASDDWKPYHITPIDAVRERGEPFSEKESLTDGVRSQSDKCSDEYLKLKHYEERCHIVLEQTNTIMLEWNAETKSYYSSSLASQFTLAGNLESLKSQYCIREEDIFPEDWPIAKKIAIETKRGAERVEMIVRLKKIDGSYPWCKFVLTIKRDNNRIRWMLITINDVDEAVKNRKSLEYRAEYDEVTGHLNYSRFKMDVAKLLQERGNIKYSLWYCDIKNFKLINDIYGYEVGDHVLQYWTKIIEQESKEQEVFSRVMADHFSALKRYEDRDDLTLYFQRVAKKLSEYKGFRGKAFRVEIVSGIYCIETEEDVLNVEEMINRANIAQKSVKQLGGSHVAFYTETMRNQMIQEQEIEASMHLALIKKEFCVYLQPQFAIQGHPYLIGAEALVRWKKPDRSLVSPGEFIPLFEKNGFIVQLDLYVFEEVCNYLKSRMQKREKLMKLAINVSKISIFQSDFVERYVGIKEKYAIPDDILELECTESIFVNNIKLLNDIVEKMHSHGFTFSLDDFGSGYSSLNMLKDVSVDVLKLDMMFFQNGLSEERDKAIVTSIITMAKLLGMQIVAEGVETKSQLETLRRLECDVVQGYVFGAPTCIAEFEARFSNSIQE